MPVPIAPIGKRLLCRYLSQPYSWSLGRNSADLSKTILSEVNLIILNAITPMLNLLANSAVYCCVCVCNYVCVCVCVCVCVYIRTGIFNYLSNYS